MELNIENVRGFAGHHKIELKPITILIGENSSGKTTLLATLAAALSASPASLENPFNRAPFELGSFDTIATYRGGAYGRATHFAIGLNIPRPKFNFWMQYESSHGSPVVNAYRITTPQCELNFDFNAHQLQVSSGQEYVGRRISTTVEFHLDRKADTSIDMLTPILPQLHEALTAKKSGSALFEHVFRAIRLQQGGRPKFIGLAPLRQRPRRTYDELIEEVKPEGDHVPVVLSRLLHSTAGQASDVATDLTNFGKASGLFEKIFVRRMGKLASDPFQVRIKLKGPDANLTDVGYGVSQALPIIVDSLVSVKGAYVLIQQPEVHLHPRAQAALGDFFVSQATSGSKNFVIETHSDYLIDRIRMAIGDGRISADMVQLVYLDRNKLDSRAHHLNVGNSGEIVDPPNGYRAFFLEEEYKIITKGIS